MVRITVKICLFTFFTFSQFLTLDSLVVARTDGSVDYRELMYLPDSSSNGLADSKIQRFFDFDCNFENRFQFTQALQNRNELAINHLIADSEFDAPPVPRPAQDTSLSTQADSTAPLWSAANQLVRSQRASLISNWQFAEQYIPGFCTWANEQSQPTVSIKTKIAMLPAKTSKSQLAAIQKRISVPLFLIADRPTEKVTLSPIKQLPIPMFLIADQSEVEVLETHGESEAPNSDSTESPISLEVENEDSDPYWQYYDDCDRWGVDFARLLHQSVSAEPLGSKFVDVSKSQDSYVVMASFESPVELQPCNSYFFLLRTLTEHAPSALLCSVPPIFDFKAQSLNELIAFGEFNFVEQQNIEPKLVYVRPLGPVTQALVLRQRICQKPVWQSLSELKQEINFKSISCYIHEVQVDYSEHIAALLVKAQQMEFARQNRLRHRVADRITQVADWLTSYADSIRPDGTAVVATNPSDKETK